MTQGRYDEAEPLLVETLKVSRDALGEKHVVTQDALSILERLLKNLASQAQERYHDSAAHSALLTLTHVDKLRQAFLGSECPPSELALMTMILHELGHNLEAEATLDRLRYFFESGRHSCEPYEEKYLRKVEQLLASGKSPIYQAWECIEAGKFSEARYLIEKLQQSHHQESDRIIGQVRSVRKALARAYYRRGRKAYQRGGDYAKTITDYETALQIDPGLDRALNSLAWLRATSALPDFRGGTLAIDAATKACTLTDWEDYAYIGTLAAAYAEAGDFPSAVQWQKEALDLLPEDRKPHDQDKMKSRLKLY